MKKFFASLSLLIFAVNVAFAQSRRVPPKAPSVVAATVTSNAKALKAAVMYEEVRDYAGKKFAEFTEKKIPYSESLRKQVLSDQKKLAAKYAAQLAAQTMQNDDAFFLGMLYATADDNEKSADAMRKFLAIDNSAGEQTQTARYIIGVVRAKQKLFDEAEKILADYLTNTPLRYHDQSAIERNLAKNYRDVKKFELAILHSNNLLTIAKTSLKDASTKLVGVSDIFEANEILLSIYTATDDKKSSEKALQDLRETAISVSAAQMFVSATDRLVTFFIENGRKIEALKILDDISDDNSPSLSKEFRAQVKPSIKRRDKQLRLLGETAPELTLIDKWLGGDSQKLANLRGKVVLLDFWATWCGPCIEMFPALVKIHQTYQDKGLIVIGMTKYYGVVNSVNVDEATELLFLEKFKKTNKLSYPFAVGKNNDNQWNYGATSLPTSVLIDKKGVIRVIDTGVGRETAANLEKQIEKLLAEK